MTEPASFDLQALPRTPSRQVLSDDVLPGFRLSLSELFSESNTEGLASGARLMLKKLAR